MRTLANFLDSVFVRAAKIFYGIDVFAEKLGCLFLFDKERLSNVKFAHVNAQQKKIVKGL